MNPHERKDTKMCTKIHVFHCVFQWVTLTTSEKDGK